MFTNTGDRAGRGIVKGMTFIDQKIASGGPAIIQFKNIPQKYNTLKLLWAAQDTTAGTNLSPMRLMINNDATAANYSNTQRSGAEAAIAIINQVASSVKGVQIGFLPNAGNTNIYASGEITLVNYSSQLMHKPIYSWCTEEDVTNGLLVIQIGTRWRSLIPIFDLTIGTDGTAFSVNSTFTLYGL